MDFFEQQDQSRRSTRILIVLYALAVVATGVVLHLALCLAYAWATSEADSVLLHFKQTARDPQIALIVLGSTFSIILLSSLIKIVSLRAGGATVAHAMGGREAQTNTHDALERRLLNVVEEMSLAAGVSMPRVFILDNEARMNAFAAGFSTKDAAVAVTRGLLETVRRDELQAIIGHEFSHILNGDMRLNIRLMGVLHGIFALVILGYLCFRGAGLVMRAARPRKKGDSTMGIAVVLLVLGVLCWLIGQIGYFFGRLIQSSVSRQREYLADASAVQFTRNPTALANALKLIGVEGSALRAPHVSEVSHMLFASGLSSVFATHPPLLQRIKRLDPLFDGDFATTKWTLQQRRKEQLEADDQPASADEPLTGTSLAAIQQALRYTGPVQETPTEEHALALDWLSDEARAILRDPLSATCAMCGALLSDDLIIRTHQLGLLPHRFENDTAMNEGALAWREWMKNLSSVQRRMLCELALNAVRTESTLSKERLCNSIFKLCSADGAISLFEFVLICMIRRRLLPRQSTAQARKSIVAPTTLHAEISAVLSVLAAQSVAPEAAFSAGASHLESLTGPLTYQTTAATPDYKQLDKALARLERLSGILKREVMKACQIVVESDGTQSDDEINLLYAIADAIDAIGWNHRSSLV